MAKIGGKLLGSNIYLCKKLTFRNSDVTEKRERGGEGSWAICSINCKNSFDFVVGGFPRALYKYIAVSN